MVLTLSLVAAFAAMARARSLRDLREGGNVATARVVGKQVLTHPKAPDEHLLEFVFLANGREYRDQQDVQPARYESTRIGDAVEVTYSPDHPKIHVLDRVDEARVRRAEGEIWTALLAGCLILAILGIPVTILIREEMQLLRDGLPVEVRVLTARRSTGKGAGTTFAVTYEGECADHTPLRGSATLPKRLWDRFQPGAAVTVVYDPTCPSRNKLYRDFGNAELAK